MPTYYRTAWVSPIDDTCRYRHVGYSFFCHRNDAQKFMTDFYDAVYHAEFEDIDEAIDPLDGSARPVNGDKCTFMIEPVSIPFTNLLLADPGRRNSAFFFVRADDTAPDWIAAKQLCATGKPRSIPYAVPAVQIDLYPNKNNIIAFPTPIRDDSKRNVLPKPKLKQSKGGSTLRKLFRVAWLDQSTWKVAGYTFHPSKNKARTFVTFFQDLHALGLLIKELPAGAKPVAGIGTSFIADRVYVAPRHPLAQIVTRDSLATVLLPNNILWRQGVMMPRKGKPKCITYEIEKSEKWYASTSDLVPISTPIPPPHTFVPTPQQPTHR
jgi:hypothetical protein